ncbi:hypothetical protein AB0O28_19195 [Microbispora sp. NPDC088329]|uniref:hypothetical protein n=1 Tax=Microbispora sp. NPDC088329 TaxID=3154869 RepID=UPI003448E539
MPDLRLMVHSLDAAARHEVRFDITSELVLETKPGVSRPFRMLATRLRLSWSWHTSGRHVGEWHLFWMFHGHRYRTTTGDWSPHEKGFMGDREIDLPDWVLPLIEANAPMAPPVVIVDPMDDEPECRICGCTENEGCPGGCVWVPDPEGKGEICSAHFITAETLVDQQIVRCVEWNDGDPVRILRVQLVAGPDGETFVRYQDVAAQHPAIGELVDRHHLVIPAGGVR